ncbi:MAG TPA: HTTM domain-containing protein [Gemmataceae bacterium]|nr:HTTM domain-containing protein [Gemmataceae bacterium]
MSTTAAALPPTDWFWVRFWHKPVRAERLALMRIMLTTALLADQLVQYAPNLAEFFGPEGVAYAGLWDVRQLKEWRISYVFFGTDNLFVIYSAFALWVTVTILLLVGWQTRWINVLCWLLTRCFLERNPNIIYGADDVLQAAMFLLILTPSGAAWSLDAWRKRRQGLLEGPVWVPPWSLRIIQIQLCLIYCTSGLAKLKGAEWGEGFWTTWPEGITLPLLWERLGQWLRNSQRQWPKGSWWDGTAIHYVINDTTMARWAYARFPIPFWITRIMTYTTVWWEVLFPLLVLSRWSRPYALVFGIMFHVGVLITVDIGWFGYYMLSFYAVWVPDSFWQRFDKNPSVAPAAPASQHVQTAPR